MIGLAIGVAAGGVQFWLLSKFTARITSGAGMNLQATFFFIMQFLLPLGALIAVGFLRRSDLLPAALGIIGALIVGAILKYVIITRKTRGHRGNNG
jgi:hypothetical protein